MKIFSSLGKALKSKKTKKIISVIVVIAIIGGGAAWYYTRKGKKTAEKITTAVATRGNIRVVVSGSAALEAIDSYEVKATVAGDVLTCSFNEGDTVEKDQVLYTIDTTDMQNTIDRAELSMQKTRDAYNSTQKEIAKLTIKTPINGVITNMYIKNGDNVSNGAKICDIIDTSSMLLTVPFNEADSQQIYAGQTAEITLDNSFYNTTGVVKRVSTGSIANENNVSTVYVEISVENPGGIKKGDTATAVIGDVACNSSGTFDAAAEQTVTAEISGKVSRIYNDLGDRVYAGGTIATLSSDNLTESLKNQEINMKDANLSLQNTYDRLDNYTIKAPISGTVIYKNVKAGDTLDNTASAPTLCYIADLSTIVFSLSVDELDISKIEVGQRVEIDADAVEGRQYTGYVKTVSINGTTVNGVTTYPVEIEVADPDGLIPGMNVNADIIIEEKENVLVVPVSAVMRGNICYVKDSEDATGKDGDKNKEQSGKIPAAPNGQGGNGWGNAPGGASGGNSWGGAPGGNAPGGAQNGSSDKTPGGWGNAPGRAPGGAQNGASDKSSGEASGKAVDGSQGGASEKAPDAAKKDPSEKTSGEASGKASGGAQNGASGNTPGNIPGGMPGGAAGGSGKSSSGKNGAMNSLVPEGFHIVRVTTGANDENYIEITSGLSEGDIVYVKTTSGTTTNPFMQGGMGGGMPSGGMGGQGGWGGGQSGNRSGTGSWGGGQSVNRSGAGGTGGWGGGQSGNRSGTGGMGGMR